MLRTSARRSVSRFVPGAEFACNEFPSNSLHFQLCQIALISIQLTRNWSRAPATRSIASTHLALGHRMVMRQLKCRANVQVTLETSVRRLSRIDDRAGLRRQLGRANCPVYGRARNPCSLHFLLSPAIAREWPSGSRARSVRDMSRIPLSRRTPHRE